MTTPVTLCLTTVGSEEDAARIARHLVETKAAACVSIVAPVRSVYSWKGEVHDEAEWLLLIKTARSAPSCATSSAPSTRTRCRSSSPSPRASPTRRTRGGWG